MQVYHLDLHGNVRKNPKLSGTTHNVFGIQVGVGITIAIRNSAKPEPSLHYFRVPENWTRVEKLAFLDDKKGLGDIKWQILRPDVRQTWLTEGMQADFETFLPMGTKEAKSGGFELQDVIFKLCGITSDPNRADDEEYIVRLVGRVVTVSVETVKLVRALPQIIEEKTG